MKKLLISIIAVVGLVSLTGCTYEESSLSKDATKVEETQKRVQNNIPIPEIKTSAERKNISERAKFFDNENLTTYIYLLTKNGSVAGFYPVRGKVSSLKSYLTPIDKVVDPYGRACGVNGYTQSCYVVGAPDIDGAYGDNADGIFFFTADTGAYVEWNGEYLVSSQPLNLATQPILIREIK